MRQQPMSLSRVAVATVAIVSMSVSAFGQSGQLIAKPSADAAAAQDASVRHLTVDEAVKLALEQNLGVQIQRIDPQVQDEGVAQARSAWLPNISSSFTKNSNSSPSTSSLSGTASTITSGLFSGGVGVNELLPWGGSYNASWGSSRSTTTDISSFFNPILRSNVTANFTQPLLRNFTIDTARQNVAVSKKIRDISDVNLHATMVQTARSVKNAYWDLVYQIDNLKAAQESLDLAKQSLKDNTRRVEIGTMAPIDIVDAKVEVARNEEARLTIQESDINIRYFRNQILPDVSVLASYQAAGLGGVQFQPANVLDPTALSTDRLVVAERSFGSALNQVFTSAYPAWSVGFQVNYPLGLSTSKANLERAKLQYQQSQTQMRNVEMQVVSQVRTVARAVMANQKRVESATASRQLAEQKLDAEEKKFAAGIRETFFVFQAQRDLSTARTAEVKAIADYNKSLVDFEAVQEVAVGGGTGGVNAAGSGASSAGPGGD